MKKLKKIVAIMLAIVIFAGMMPGIQAEAAKGNKQLDVLFTREFDSVTS